MGIIWDFMVFEVVTGKVVQTYIYVVYSVHIVCMIVEVCIYMGRFLYIIHLYILIILMYSHYELFKPLLVNRERKSLALVHSPIGCHPPSGKLCVNLTHMSYMVRQCSRTPITIGINVLLIVLTM